MDFKVQVAVRVRPADGESVISTTNQEVQVLDSAARTQKRQFTFDRVFPHLATQRDVFEFGGQIVEHSLEGYNACIFAYGQTGSGKSHTMLGTSRDPGLVPQVCRQIFRFADDVKNETAVTIRVSFLEIYNEHIRDLLVKHANSLKIRGGEDCHVSGLSEHTVETVDHVVALLKLGAANRATAATKMNDTSSRSHAVVTLSIKQQLVSDKAGEVQEKTSTLRLVDLAGSERAASTGATGDRLREGGNINKSLVTLGRVISALAASEGQTTSQVIPYRDSVLTRLLQPNLGGNSRTAMIACVSPLRESLDQTVSTLRYAAQAKRITTRAKINKDVLSSQAKNEQLQQMQQELAELRKQLSEHTTEEDRLLEESRMAKLLQFYEDEAARERVRANLMERQREAADQRALALADYVREIGGQGMSSVDLRHAASFEEIMEERNRLEADVQRDHSEMKQSLQRWKARLEVIT